MEGGVVSPEQAIDVIAREALSRFAAEAMPRDEWENFPEIGEHDWEKVAERVQQLAPSVPRDDYLAAYALLEGRAEDVS
jgi:hypothetical protein